MPAPPSDKPTSRDVRNEVDDPLDGWREVRRDRVVAAAVGIGWGLPMTVWASISTGLLAGVGMLLLVLPAVVGLSMIIVDRLTRKAAKADPVGRLHVAARRLRRVLRRLGTQGPSNEPVPGVTGIGSVD